MRYCKKCKRIYYENKDVCECGSKSFLNEAPKPEDPTYLTTASGFELERITAVLEDEGMPFETHFVKKASSSVPVISGTTTGNANILVPFAKLQDAKDILIGISAKEYPGEVVEKEEKAKDNDIQHMSRAKRTTLKVISLVMFLALVAAVVFATDFVTGWIKGLF